MLCTHPECTGVHDNSRFSELCPRSREAKRIKDRRYIYNETIIAGRLTKGDVVRRHRRSMARVRRNRSTYGEDSKVANWPVATGPPASTAPGKADMPRRSRDSGPSAKAIVAHAAR
jgi:hypothetical protein